MSSPARHRIRQLSDVLFGQRYRLEVMIAVARSDGIVCLTDLARELDITPSNLQRPLQSLTLAGLLTKDEPTASRHVYYRRSASLAWQFVLELEQRAAAESDQRPK